VGVVTGFGFRWFFACWAVEAAFERLQQLAGVLKVTAPEQTGAFTG
jgi:hypothetical protein